MLNNQRVFLVIDSPVMVDQMVDSIKIIQDLPSGND